MTPLQIVREQLGDIARESIALLPQLAVALVVLTLTLFASKFARALLSTTLGRSAMRASLKELLLNLTGLLSWMVGLVIAAVIVFPNLSPANALAGLGLGSVAIGFAFKDVFENFLAGLIILFRREMRIGDTIQCQGLDGKVEKISVRETHIRQTDGQLVIVPNALLFKNPLTIRTDLEQRRVTLMCGIAYGESIEQSRNVIDKAVRDCQSVSTAEDRPVQVFAHSFGDSSIDFEISWWTGSSPVDIRRSRDEVVASVHLGLGQAGIEIPYPYRTLTFAEPVPVRTMPSNQKSEDCRS